MRIARALRLVGYALVLVVGEPLWIQPLSYDRRFVCSTRFPAWVAAYAVLALAFHVSASASEGARGRRLGALAVMTLATLTMAALLPCEFGSLSLVVVASQAALLLSPRQTAAFIAVLTAGLGCLLVRADGWVDGGSHLIGLLAAESFAAVAVHLARLAAHVAHHEAETARELAHVNAELRATRTLLEETSRAHERTRISRELHDVLGHDLTALGLQLEVATHVAPDRAAPHVAKAQEVSARLLRNVRDVVGTMRDAPAANLGCALRTLVEGVPGMAVHLEMPRDLHVNEGARGHCILRCVQEIITNALKHSRASNLWITIAVADGAITLDARDDGRGASEVCAGHGLSGMRARLEEMGGWLRVAAEPSRAFAVSAWLPAP
jgi:signal transduction histidine kinase